MDVFRAKVETRRSLEKRRLRTEQQTHSQEENERRTRRGERGGSNNSVKRNSRVNFVMHLRVNLILFFILIYSVDRYFVNFSLFLRTHYCRVFVAR